jgi:DNA-binding CsgD family transcriptional regulator/PAS domain-containing protein
MLARFPYVKACIRIWFGMVGCATFTGRRQGEGVPVRDDLEAVLGLTGEIYDAALDPGMWPQVLQRITAFVDGVSSVLISHDAASRANRFHFTWGDNPDYSRSYQDTYARLNPINPILLMMNPGELWSVATAMPMKQFRQTRFYLEWVKPQNGGDVIGAILERSGTVITSVATSLDAPRSPASDKTKHRMSLIMPHVRRAVAIGNVIEMHRVEAETLGDAIDALGAAVFLVRGDGEILRANASGRALVEAGTLLRAIDSRLAAVDQYVRRDLGRALADAAEGDRFQREGRTSVPLVDRLGERYVAHILPLTAGARRLAGRSTGAAAAVFVQKAEMGCVFPMEAICRQFELSKAELRVLVGMLEIGPPAEIAPVLGLSEATVRTHLRRLFEKTGTSRQADLVKLVAGYASPLMAPAA